MCKRLLTDDPIVEARGISRLYGHPINRITTDICAPTLMVTRSCQSEVVLLTKSPVCFPAFISCPTSKPSTWRFIQATEIHPTSTAQFPSLSRHPSSVLSLPASVSVHHPTWCPSHCATYALQTFPPLNHPNSSLS